MRSALAPYQIWSKSDWTSGRTLAPYRTYSAASAAAPNASRIRIGRGGAVSAGVVALTVAGAQDSSRAPNPSSHFPQRCALAVHENTGAIDSRGDVNCQVAGGNEGEER